MKNSLQNDHISYSYVHKYDLEKKNRIYGKNCDYSRALQTTNQKSAIHGFIGHAPPSPYPIKRIDND